MTDFNNNILNEMIMTFEKEFLSFENNISISLPNNNLNFGILSLKAKLFPLHKNNNIYEFIFTVDCSGSMSDNCSDNRSKMDHIIHTIKNIINYFKENSNLNIFITVIAFDSRIHKIIERTTIDENNYLLIEEKINKLRPRDSTNIEVALKEINNIIEDIKYNDKENNHKIVNIFMTDGEISSGSSDSNYLANLINNTITNIFIGFGLNHDSVLLNKLCEGINSSYYFIDKLENSGLVYGEILNDILNNVLYNVKITIESGLIYDFKNNLWVSSLYIGNIISETNKIIHCVSNDVLNSSIELKGFKSEDNSEYITIIKPNINKNKVNYTELKKYIFRQRTLQYLFEVNNYLKQKKENTNKNNYVNYSNWSDVPDIDNSFKDVEKLLKEKLVKFMDEIKTYMNVHNLNNDNFLKNLCDDIYITFRTIGSKYASMFVTSRQNTQGNQRQYTTGKTLMEDNSFNYNNNKRNRNSQSFSLFDDNLIEENEFNDMFNILNHDLLDVEDTPYSTNSATQLMREISSQIKSPNGFGDNDEESQTQLL